MSSSDQPSGYRNVLAATSGVQDQGYHEEEMSSYGDGGDGSQQQREFYNSPFTNTSRPCCFEAPSQQLERHLTDYPEDFYREQVTHFADCHDVMCHMLTFIPEVEQIPLRRVSSNVRAAVDEGGVLERAENRVNTLVRRYNERKLHRWEPISKTRSQILAVIVVVYLLFGLLLLLLEAYQNDFDAASNLTVVALVIGPEISFVLALAIVFILYSSAPWTALRAFVKICLLATFATLACYYAGIFFTARILRDSPPAIAECLHIEGKSITFPSQVLVLAPAWWEWSGNAVVGDDVYAFQRYGVRQPFPEWMINCTAALLSPYAYAENFSVPSAIPSNSSLWPSAEYPKRVWGIDDDPNTNVAVTNRSELLRTYGLTAFGNITQHLARAGSTPIMFQTIRHSVWHSTVEDEVVAAAYRRTGAWTVDRFPALSQTTGLIEICGTDAIVWGWVFAVSGVCAILGSIYCWWHGRWKYEQSLLNETRGERPLRQPLTQAIVLELFADQIARLKGLDGKSPTTLTATTSLVANTGAGDTDADEADDETLSASAASTPANRDRRSSAEANDNSLFALASPPHVPPQAVAIHTNPSTEDQTQPRSFTAVSPMVPAPPMRPPLIRTDISTGSSPSPVGGHDGGPPLATNGSDGEASYYFDRTVSHSFDVALSQSPAQSEMFVWSEPFSPL